jgi:hypothetical protein
VLNKYGVEIEALHFLCGCYTCNRYRLPPKFSFGMQSPIGRLPLLWFVGYMDCKLRRKPYLMVMWL